MRTLNRVHQFSRASFAHQGQPNSAGHLKSKPTAPDHGAATSLFPCAAYSDGQWCLPYNVPIRKLRWASGRTS